jgi:hypothetical protein
MEVEYLAILPSDQGDLHSNLAYSADTEHEYLAVLCGEQELPQRNMQCARADSVEAEYLAVLPSDEADLHSDEVDLHSSVAHHVDTEDKYEVLQKCSEGDMQTYLACNSTTQSTSAILDDNTDTNSHIINVNIGSTVYNGPTNINADLPTYGMNETRQHADANILRMTNTEHHPDTNVTYSQLEDFSSDLNGAYIYAEELSITNIPVSNTYCLLEG